MFTNYLQEFEANQAELFRQAENYRLAKSLKAPNTSIRKAMTGIGKLLVASGQQIINHYQSAQQNPSLS